MAAAFKDQRFVVVWNFVAEDVESELSVREGEVVAAQPLPRDGLRDEEGWTLVRVLRRPARNGYVPTSYLSPVNLEPCSPGRMLAMTTAPPGSREPAYRTGRPIPRERPTPRPPRRQTAREGTAPPQRERTRTPGMHYASSASPRRAGARNDRAFRSPASPESPRVRAPEPVWATAYERELAARARARAAVLRRRGLEDVEDAESWAGVDDVDPRRRTSFFEEAPGEERASYATPEKRPLLEPAGSDLDRLSARLDRLQTDLVGMAARAVSPEASPPVARSLAAAYRLGCS